MHDLVGAYERVNSVYQKYIESAFPLRYRNMAAERRKLFSSSAALSQPPLVEPTPIYPSSDLTLAEAVKHLDPGYADLPNLAQGLLPNSDIRLWKHQWRSLESVISHGKDIVVTTGTGSGKTECFLLPLLAELARESRLWPGSSTPPIGREWWNDDSAGWRSQWEHTGRNRSGMHAVRALVLYPLNALVEDQLRRLRQTLDADRVLKWLDNGRGRNRITFGRYTGATPVSGEPTNRNAVARLRGRLRDQSAESEAVIGDIDLPPDVRYYFPNVNGGEMWSRWDMQQTPPDILITNYHMLNIMLMRQIEAGVFEKTRRWLEADSSNRFFLIIDELHAYRGTPGTEVAYVLRLLLERIGLSPNSDQLGLMATSASVEDGADSRRFLREFFGRDRFEIISADQQPPERNARQGLVRFETAFSEFARTIQPDTLQPMAPPDQDADASKQAIVQLVESLEGEKEKNSDVMDEPGHRLATSLESVKAGDALRGACTTPNGGIRAAGLLDIDKAIFPNVASATNPSDAIRGLLLALGLSRKPIDNTSVQPVRGHLFFHNVENLWACANPRCNVPDHLQQLQYDLLEGPVGALHAQHRISCSCGGRVLDLLVCEVCGDIFLGGLPRKRRD